MCAGLSLQPYYWILCQTFSSKFSFLPSKPWLPYQEVMESPSPEEFGLSPSRWRLSHYITGGSAGSRSSAPVVGNAALNYFSCLLSSSYFVVLDAGIKSKERLFLTLYNVVLCASGWGFLTEAPARPHDEPIPESWDGTAVFRCLSVAAPPAESNILYFPPTDGAVGVFISLRPRPAAHGWASPWHFFFYCPAIRNNPPSRWRPLHFFIEPHRAGCMLNVHPWF